MTGRSATMAAGVDGTRAGWVCVIATVDPPAVRACIVAPTFSELLLHTTPCTAVAIDVPIGLPNRVARGGREADRSARRLLTPKRQASVFSAPPRAVLQARSYEEANGLHRDHAEAGAGMSRQAYGLLPKIAEVDDLMTPRLQRRVVETHPELAFMALQGGVPMAQAKTRAAGTLARMRVLHAAGLVEGLERHAADLGSAGLYDLLDAAAAAWTASRIATQTAQRVPEEPETDVRGLRMEIWY